MPLTPQQELEIYPLLDQVLELPVGKALLHKCAPPRANYLTRIIKGLRYESAIESIAIYDSTNPLYGQGVYANVWVEPHERGLLITILAIPADSPSWSIIQCRADEETKELNSTLSATRQSLTRMQKKYPEIMGSVWVLNDDGQPVARYTQKNIDQSIVDIDINPAEDVPTPSRLNKAYARQS